MNIKEASIFLNVSISTLRRWDKEGVLKPVRSEGGHRRYNIKDLEKVKYNKLRDKFNVGFLEVKDLNVQGFHHTLINGFIGSGKTDMAKKIFAKNINNDKLGYCIVKGEEWDDVIDPNHYNIISIDKASYIKILEIPLYTDMKDWINHLLNAFKDTINPSIECIEILNSALHTYYNSNLTSTKELLLIFIEDALKLKISYNEVKDVLDVLKTLVDKEEKSQEACKINNVLDFNKTTFVKLYDDSFETLITFKILSEYFMSKIIKENTRNYFILQDATTYTGYNNFIHMWHIGRSCNTEMIMTITNINNLNMQILCNCRLVIFMKNHMNFQEKLFDIIANREKREMMKHMIDNIYLGEGIINMNSFDLNMENKDLWILQ